MTRLEKLIEELCPNGVEYKLLSDVAIYSKERILAKDVDENTYIGVDNLLPNKQGRTISTYVPNEGNLTKYNINDILIGNIRPYLKKIWLSDGIGGTNGDVLVIHITEEQLLPKFLYYILSSDLFFLYDVQNSKGAKMPRGNKEAVMKYKIPLPPLEVQAEIVKILDAYSTSVTALQQELEKELTARKKQYEYYRDKLLSFGVLGGGTSECERRTLGEVCSIKGRIGFRGYTRNDMVEKGHGAISFSPANINNQTLCFGNDTYISWKKYNESPEIMIDIGDVLLCKTGSTLGKTAIVDFLPEKATINPQLVVLKGIQCNNRYLKYILTTFYFQNELQKRKGLGSVPNISQKEIGAITIPIPPLPKQERIVKILDRFDKLCNDISEGLPAEIKARQKQYEYYRDKLLTFKELI